MSVHRVKFDEADGRPHPFAVSVYAAGIAQMPSSQGGSPRSEPWRSATSKWSRAPGAGERRVPAASVPAYAALPPVLLAAPLPQEPE
jgi:hypothetical protein